MAFEGAVVTRVASWISVWNRQRSQRLTPTNAA
jgi:hypothetical protein